MTTCDAAQQRRAGPQPQGGASESNRRFCAEPKGVVNFAPGLGLRTERHGPHQTRQERPQSLRGEHSRGGRARSSGSIQPEESSGPQLIQVLLPRFEDGRIQFEMLACQEIVDQASLASGRHSLRTALGEAALPQQTHLSTARSLAGEAREAGERTRTRKSRPTRDQPSRMVYCRQVTERL